jgi:hypothetical protein
LRPAKDGQHAGPHCLKRQLQVEADKRPIPWSNPCANPLLDMRKWIEAI